MDATNPLCRFLMLAAGLLFLLGCRSDDSGTRARSQMPQDPLAPIAPPPMPPGPVVSAGGVVAPAGPSAPSGVIQGAAVQGSPVPGGSNGSLVLNTKYSNLDPGPGPEEWIKKSTPRIKVVAIIGSNNVITDQEVRESVWQQYDKLKMLEGHQREAKEKEMYRVALRRTIERELILEEMYTKLKKANKSGVIEDLKDISSQLAEKQLREFKKISGSRTEDDLARWLHLQGLTIPVLRRQLERQFMAQQYVNSMLKEKGRKASLLEIREYYDRHPGEYKTPDRVKWQHIYIGFGNPPNPRAAQTRMDAVRQKLAAGEEFAALSKQFDEGFAKFQNGSGTGELRATPDNKQEDWVQPADLEETVWSLKAGEVSAVVQTPTGYHLVKVVQRDYAGVRPLDAKLQGEIRDKLNAELLKIDEAKMVEDLWRRGVVRVIEE
jgi:parvulin-like peptidyl-prolyl isomerase